MAYSAQTLQYPTARPTGVQNCPNGEDLYVGKTQCGNYSSLNAPIYVGDIMVDVGIYCGNNNAFSANCVPGNTTYWGNAAVGAAAFNNATGMCGAATGLIITSGKTIASNVTCTTATSNAASCAALQELVHDSFMGVSSSYRDPSVITTGTERDNITLLQDGAIVYFTLVGVNAGATAVTPGSGNGATPDGLTGAIGAGGNSYGNNLYCAPAGLPVAIAPFTPTANNATFCLDANNLPCVEILGMNNATGNMAKYSIGSVAKPVLPTDSQVAVKISCGWNQGGAQNIIP